MEEQTKEKVEEVSAPEVENKLNEKNNATADYVLLALGVITIVVLAIWLGLNTEKRFGSLIQQKFFKTNAIVPETSTKPGGNGIIVNKPDKGGQVQTAFYYPNSKEISKTKGTNTFTWKLSSADSPTDVQKYYRDLIALNKWKTVRVGGDTSVIKITQSDFSALVTIAIVDKSTEITIDAQFSNAETETPSTFDIPTKDPFVSLTPSPTGEEKATGEYILSFSDTRLVTTGDLKGLTPWELKVARNEIYARHGRSFVHQDLSCYFTKQTWYTQDPDYSDENLSTVEVKNASTILAYEKSINSPLISKDSGCQP